MRFWTLFSGYWREALCVAVVLAATGWVFFRAPRPARDERAVKAASLDADLKSVHDKYARNNESYSGKGEAWRATWRKKRNDEMRDCYRRHGEEIPQWLANNPE